MKDSSLLVNKVYAAIIGECERLEHEKIYRGNGHHLAQKLTKMIEEGYSNTPDESVEEMEFHLAKIRKLIIDYAGNEGDGNAYMKKIKKALLEFGTFCIEYGAKPESAVTEGEKLYTQKEVDDIENDWNRQYRLNTDALISKIAEVEELKSRLPAKQVEISPDPADHILREPVNEYPDPVNFSKRDTKQERLKAKWPEQDEIVDAWGDFYEDAGDVGSFASWEACANWLKTKMHKQ